MKLPVNMHNGNLADPDPHTADYTHTRPHAHTGKWRDPARMAGQSICAKGV